MLFVNVTHQMAREAITQLEQSGVNQLQFIPYGPDVFTMEPTFGDDVVPENVKLAVTPDEMDFVPAGMEQVINIGHRPCNNPGFLITGKNFPFFINADHALIQNFQKKIQLTLQISGALEHLLKAVISGSHGVNIILEFFFFHYTL